MGGQAVRARVSGMKILLFGRNGQVGWELQRSLAPLGELVALGSHPGANPHVNGRALQGNFMQPEGLIETIQRVRPDVIVNAAAYTAVDKAEIAATAARMVNAEAVGVLAREAQRTGAALVHYSTDYVFNGSDSRPWRETDSPDPLNIYGKTKLEGEHAIQQHCERHLIFRTSWVYAARGMNFAKTMLRLGKERNVLSVVNDQYGAPTGAELIADVTAHAVRKFMREPACAGLYHLVAGGETTWHGYASHVFNVARNAGVMLQVTPQDVMPVASSEFPTPAVRPVNSRLDSSKLQRAFDIHLPDWRLGLNRMLFEVLV